MNERVVEILVYIMTEMRRNQNVSSNLDLLSSSLIQKGYSESEISSAFSWLMDRINNEPEEVFEKHGPAFRHSVRHLHEIEKSVISVEAHGYLIQLHALGIIDEFDLEQILERGLMLGIPRVSVEEIKSIVAGMFLASEEGSRGGFFLLNDDPTIQ